MSASTAIGMVSESLRNLLIAEMTLTPAVNVTLLAPDEPGGERRVNLFLYKVQENPFLKNAEWQPKPDAPGTLMPPPLSLNLFYLMTCYAKSDPPSGNMTMHQILGEAMRVFYENPVLTNAHLANGLQGAREQIKIVQNTLDMEELARVWSTFTQPFRLSVLYQVSVVQLDPLPASERPMAPRVQRVGVPSVQAPFVPPTLNDLAPADIRGPGGRTLNFTGRNLVGWRAYATVSGQPLADGLTLSQDSFALTLPNDLPSGFHEIRADVSHLFRKTFFVEVVL